MYRDKDKTMYSTDICINKTNAQSDRHIYRHRDISVPTDIQIDSQPRHTRTYGMYRKTEVQADRQS